MKPAYYPRITFAVLTALALNTQPRSLASAESEIRDSWRHDRDEQTGLLVQTREIRLTPRPAPRPALKIRLLPGVFEAVKGNAAVHYLKASGFLEQESARDRLREFHKRAREKVEKEGGDFDKLEPYVWLNMHPAELPLQKVKDYLLLTSFQAQFLREGAKRDRFDMDRNFREVDDPIAYLLPEIQGLREIARTQSLRCRVAIAEGRIDDAIEIVGQQFAMARHLGQDDFLVSNLVGIAIASIAWSDLLYVVEHPKSPNLYWALTTMPSPLVDMTRSMAVERQFLYQQMKVLKEVDEDYRPPGYWRTFIDRLVGEFGMLAGELRLPSPDRDVESARSAVVAFVAAAYPGAKEYLLKELHLPRDQVEAYPTAQVVFLAMTRYYDEARDDFFKWTHLPFWQARSKQDKASLEKGLRESGNRYGWCTLPTQLLLPAVLAARTAEARCNQHIALAQTIEGIRMYAAEHDNRLPKSLDDLTVPAPIEPFTGKSVSYQFLGDRAVITGHALPGMQYRIVVRIAG